MTLAFAVYGARWLPRLTEAVLPAGIAIGALFGLALMLAGGALARRITPRIDRAFFRSAYDAQQILEDLSESAVAASTRDELASLLDGQLRAALQPARLLVYLHARDGRLTRHVDSGGPSPESLDPALELVQAAARAGRPWDVSTPDAVDTVAASPLAAVAPECLVPMLGRGRRLAGLLVLGPRLSDEPYSREDHKLLASVASQAGIALENLALAEEMADRLEVERRSAREVEIAAEVQRRLLPQTRRVLRTAEYRRPLRAGEGDWRRLLRFHRPRRRPARSRARRRVRQGPLRGPAHGQSPGPVAEPVGEGLRGPPRVARVGEPGFLRVHVPQPLRDPVHGRVRRPPAVPALHQLRARPADAVAECRHARAPRGHRRRRGTVRAVVLHGGGVIPASWRSPRRGQRRRVGGDVPGRRGVRGRPTRARPSAACANVRSPR